MLGSMINSVQVDRLISFRNAAVLAPFLPRL